MVNQQHTIKNQVCKIEVQDHIDYHMLRDRINYTLQRLVYPKLGFICDKYSEPDIHYTVRSLEINLGTVDLSNIASVLVEQVPREFEIALCGALKKLSTHEISAEGSANKAHIQSQELEIELQTVQYFLNTGTLPWWNKDNKKSLTSMLMSIATRHLGKTKQLLSFLNPKAWNRLIIQQNDHQLSLLVKSISPELQNDTNKLYQDLQKLIYSTKAAATLSSNKLRQHYWSFMITFAISKSSKKNITTFIDELISYLVFVVDKTNYMESIKHIIQQVQVADKQSSIHPSLTSWAKKAKGKTHALFQLFDAVSEAAKNISMLSLKEQSLLNKILKIFKNFTTNPSALDSNRRSLMKVLAELVNLLQKIPRNSDSGQHKDWYKKIVSLTQQIQTTPSKLSLSLQNLGSCLTNTRSRKSRIVQAQELQGSEDLILGVSSINKKEQLLLNKILKISKNFTTDRSSFEESRSLLMKALGELIKSLQKTPRGRDSSRRKGLCEKMISLMQKVQTAPSTFPSFLQDLESNLINVAPSQKEDLTLRTSGVSDNDVYDIFSQNSISLDQTYYIENAGLVLYWVYLKNLFTKFKVLKENQAEFLDNRANIRAALLLNLCVHGHSRNIPEYELALNKILCGRQVDSLLPSTLRVKRTEEREGNTLTSTLISHWQALGKITVEGFRREFVQRSGSITEQEGRYILRVEKKPQDVLLDKLPWAINVIKLPWMKNYLTVEW